MLNTIQCWLFALLSMLCMGNARAEVHYDERTETFEVGAREGTPDEIWAGIRRWGPTGGDMHARSVIVGQAAGKLRWAWSLANQGGSCRVAKRDVYVSVTIRLPDWRYRAFASSEQKAYWDCIEDIVTVHEKRHAEIWRETGRDIDNAMARMTAFSCDELNTSLRATALHLHAEGRARQRTFDTEDGKLRRFDRCETLVAPKVAAGTPLPKPAAKPRPTLHAPHVATARVDTPRSNGPIDTSFWLLAAGVVVSAAISVGALVRAFRK